MKLPDGDAIERRFSSVLNSPIPGDDAALADLIEQDGRHRLGQGLPCDLDRYCGAVPELASRPIALDAAIDISLRSIALRSGVSDPTQEHAESLLRSYPNLSGPIRVAALLNNIYVTSTVAARREAKRPPCGLPRSVGQTLEDGRLRYELIRELGSEAPAARCSRRSTILLSDSAHAARVAVKLVLIDSSNVQRQAAEATKARRVQHPNVVRVLDRGVTDEDELFLVYDLVEGGDLQSWFERRHQKISCHDGGPPRDADCRGRAGGPRRRACALRHQAGQRAYGPRRASRASATSASRQSPRPAPPC